MNRIIPYLKTAKALPGFILWLEYEDGVKGQVRLETWRQKKPFTMWDEKSFSLFTITADKKLEWNEEVDMDPDAFYLQLINKTFEEYASDKQLLRHSD